MAGLTVSVDVNVGDVVQVLDIDGYASELGINNVSGPVIEVSDDGDYIIVEGDLGVFVVPNEKGMFRFIERKETEMSDVEAPVVEETTEDAVAEAAVVETAEPVEAPIEAPAKRARKAKKPAAPKAEKKVSKTAIAVAHVRETQPTRKEFIQWAEQELGYGTRAASTYFYRVKAILAKEAE